jgi:hypothetical protein
VAPVTSIDLMARRALKDEMPGIMLRAAVRSTGKAIAQYEVQHQANQRNNLGLAIVGLALTIGSVVTESADERTWRTLPSLIGVARARLPPGAHTVAIQTSEGAHTTQVTVSGRHAVVGLRLLRRQLFVQAPVPSVAVRSTDASRAPAASLPPATPEAQPPQETPR